TRFSRDWSSHVCSSDLCCVLMLAAPAVSAQQSALNGHDQQERVVLHGRVVEAGAAKAVAGAEVRAACHGISTVTDADGVWRLVLPVGPHELVIEHLGFATETITVPAYADAPDRVRLTPRPVALSE